MAQFSMHRNRHGRANLGVHARQFIPRRMSGDVDQLILIGDQAHAAANQAILQMPNRLLVTGDHPGREDHNIALLQGDMGMIVIGDSGQRSPWLALAPRANQYRPIRWQIADLFFIDEGNVLEIAVFLRGGDHAVQGSSNQRDLSLIGCGGQRDAFQPRNIARKAGDGDPTFRISAQEINQNGADFTLRSGLSGTKHIGAVADQGQHPFFAQSAERLLIRHVTDQRVGIELPVPRVQNRSNRRADRERVRFRDGMCQGYQFYIEVTHHKARRQIHDRNRDLTGQTGFCQFSLQNRGREGCGPDRASQARPKMMNGPDMILMGMGQNQPDQLVPMGLDEGGVRHDDVNARRLIGTERDPQIDHEPLVIVPVEIEVHPNLTGTAKR